MTHKKKIVLSLSVSSFFIAAAASLQAQNSFAKAAGEGTPTTWRHYKSIAPTDAEKGIKEYWVSCAGGNAHQFTAPSSPTDIVEEGSWTPELKASVLALADDRAIAAGDYDAYLYQGSAFAARVLSGSRDVAVDAAQRSISLRVGQDQGTTEGGVYVPSGATSAGFALGTEVLKAAHDAGYGYLNMTLSAASAIVGHEANYFAYLLNNVGSGWSRVYAEGCIDFAKGATFTFDLSKLEGFQGEYDDVALAFGIRNEAVPQLDSVEADVTIKDIQFLKEDYSAYFTRDLRSPAAHPTYRVGPDGEVSRVVFNYRDTWDFPQQTGFANNVGFSEAFAQRMLGKGKLEAVYSLDWSLDADRGDGTRYNMLGDQERYDAPATIIANLELGQSLWLGFPRSGATHQQGGTIAADLSFKTYHQSSLQIRHFGGDTVGHPYGIDAASAPGGTYENGVGEGVGGVGPATLAGGAGISLIRGGETVEKQAWFFANHLNVGNYADPQLGDEIVYRAGSYQDPDNPWGLSRKLTLAQDLHFYFNADGVFQATPLD